MTTILWMFCTSEGALIWWTWQFWIFCQRMCSGPIGTWPILNVTDSLLQLQRLYWTSQFTLRASAVVIWEFVKLSLGLKKLDVTTWVPRSCNQSHVWQALKHKDIPSPSQWIQMYFYYQHLDSSIMRNGISSPIYVRNAQELPIILVFKVPSAICVNLLRAW